MLPTTTYLTVIGYLLDEAVQRITDDILDLRDITELESERINDLLKPIRALEDAFTVQQGQPSNVVAHVPHWLKFCYVSELLVSGRLRDAHTLAPDLSRMNTADGSKRTWWIFCTYSTPARSLISRRTSWSRSSGPCLRTRKSGIMR